MPSRASCSVPVDELISLFRGCEIDGTAGYYTDALVREICVAADPQPKYVADLCDLLYPGCRAISAIPDEDAQDYVRRGFEQWEQLKRPQRAFG